MTVSTQQARPSRRSWFQDFELGWTSLMVKKTGARVPYSPSVIGEFLAWLRFFLAVLAAKPEPGAPFLAAFSPERARPWYLIWPVIRLAGGRITDMVADADVVIHFEDATVSRNAPPTVKPGAVVMNFRCDDVSKSTVAAVFGAAFGYPLAVDPAATTGTLVEKGEGNGVHDGRVVTGPCARQPGKTYQRLVDNRTDDLLFVEDFRTPTVGGKPIVVFIKRRPVDQRFANTNTRVTLAAPDSVFTPNENDAITAAAQRLGLDWGGLDVLRDRQDGRLYIVDANKTDMGPPTALPLHQKLAAARALAKALRGHVFALSTT